MAKPGMCIASGAFKQFRDAMQVVKLCRSHRLYSALTYVLTRGLDDYVAPAVELLLALADTPASLPAGEADAASAVAGGAADAATTCGADAAGVAADAARAAGFKLLVYLRCCLRRQQFPPGAGPLPPDKANIVKAGVLGAAHALSRTSLAFQQHARLKLPFALKIPTWCQSTCGWPPVVIGAPLWQGTNAGT